MVALAGCKKDEQTNSCPTISDKFAKALDLNIDQFLYYFKLSNGEVIEVDKKTYYDINYKYNSVYTPMCNN